MLLDLQNAFANKEIWRHHDSHCMSDFIIQIEQVDAAKYKFLNLSYPHPNCTMFQSETQTPKYQLYFWYLNFQFTFVFDLN